MDINATRLRDAKLGAAIENAAGKLPAHFTLTVGVEFGSAWVELYDDDGQEVELSCQEEELGDQIAYALQLAIDIEFCRTQITNRKREEQESGT